MRIDTFRAGLIVIVSLSLSAFTIAQDHPIMTPGEFHDQEWQRLVRHFQRLELDEPTPNQVNMDVTYYRLSIDTINISAQTIRGSCTLMATALVNGYLATDLNFVQTMTVDSVIIAGQPCIWNHSNDLIEITWLTPLDSGQTFTATVYYHGHASGGGFGSFQWGTHNGTPIIATLSEPEGARDWWPCKDIPNDKADSVDVLIQANSAYISTSNGILTEIIDHGDGTKTYHWHHHYPISTYLISITSTNYQTLADEYVTLSGDTMPLTHYVYPEDYSNAVIDFNITAPAITAFRQYFGEYPFTNESYGMAEFNWGGAMEHQTLTSYGEVLIRGDHYYDYILAHELAHQWWGDAVTLDDWPHIWLNEGFASYSEALWREYNFGLSNYLTYMRTRLSVSDPSGPIYDPSNLFSSNTVYHKGAWVLHMLRGVISDSIWSTLSEYGSQYRYGNATTEDFRQVAEECWGGNLEWFFQEWVYGVNRPNYRWSWDVGQWAGAYHLFINIIQQQTNADLFTMPIQFRLAKSGGDTTIVLWDSLANQTFTVTLPWQPTDASLDPDQWILRYQQEVSYPLAIASDILLSGEIEIPFADTLHGIGGTEPYSWGISAGTLPEGLELDSLTGVISGIPDSAGVFPFTVSLIDNAGGNTTREFSLQIQGLPEMVHDLVIQQLGNDMILCWGRSENANGYAIYRSSTPALPWDSLTTISDTSFIDQGITELERMGFYQVTARRD